MTHSLLISIFCPDRTGLVSSITSTLFNLGINLGDTTFAVLGGGAKLTTVCDSPLSPEEVESHLCSIPELNGADIKVSRFDLPQIHGPTAHITHKITLQGANHPGLIAQLSEVFVAFDTNIVRLDAEKIPGNEGEQYLINFSVSIPQSRVDPCLASICNTASSLQMQCHWISVKKLSA
jgi:glycine cleavage system transcriptional repressor